MSDLVRSHRVLVVGARGFLGTKLVRRLMGRGYAVLGTTSSLLSGDSFLHLDLGADHPEWLFDIDVDVAVIAAGLGSLRQCEVDPVRSLRINARGRADLATTLMSRGIHVVLISTDAVYSGDRRPIGTALPDARTVYGRHMAQAENDVLGALGSASVVRLGKVLHGRSEILLNWIGALRRGDDVHAFIDSQIAPVSLGFALDALEFAIASKSRGVINATGPDDVSWSDVAYTLAERGGWPTSRVVLSEHRPIRERRRFVALPATHDLPSAFPTGMECVRYAVDEALEVS